MVTGNFPRMHMSFYVSNLADSTVFYTKFFGQKPSKIREQYAKFELDAPSLIISFIESPEKVATNFGHVGIQVETQDEMYRRFFEAKTKGLPLVEEIGVTCCYAKQDKFWVTDPDGIEWEIYYFHEDAEFNDPRYDMSKTIDLSENTVDEGNPDAIGKGSACGCTPKERAESVAFPLETAAVCC